MRSADPVCRTTVRQARASQVFGERGREATRAWVPSRTPQKHPGLCPGSSPAARQGCPCGIGRIAASANGIPVDPLHPRQNQQLQFSVAFVWDDSCPFFPWDSRNGEQRPDQRFRSCPKAEDGDGPPSRTGSPSKQAFGFRPIARVVVVSSLTRAASTEPDSARMLIPRSTHPGGACPGKIAAMAGSWAEFRLGPLPGSTCEEGARDGPSAKLQFDLPAGGSRRL